MASPGRRCGTPRPGCGLRRFSSSSRWWRRSPISASISHRSRSRSARRSPRAAPVSCIVATVALVVAVTLSATALGTATAWVTVRTDLGSRRLVFTLLALPLVIPSYVGALAYVAALGPRGMLAEVLEYRPSARHHRLPRCLARPDRVHLPVCPPPGGVFDAKDGSLARGGGAQPRRLACPGFPHHRPPQDPPGAGGQRDPGGSLHAVRLRGGVADAVRRLHPCHLRPVRRAAQPGTSPRAVVGADRPRPARPAWRACRPGAGGTAEHGHRPTPGADPSHTGMAGRRRARGRCGDRARGGGAGDRARLLAAAGTGRDSRHSARSGWRRDARCSPRERRASWPSSPPFRCACWRFATRAARRRWWSGPRGLSTPFPTSPSASPSSHSAARLGPPIYQSLALLVIAYVVLFLPQALGAGEASLRQIPPSLEEASRSLGRSWWSTLRRITVPLMGKGLIAGGALVFLTAMKELPATLLLRPTGFETLWRSASLRRHRRASTPGPAPPPSSCSWSPPSRSTC